MNTRLGYFSAIAMVLAATGCGAEGAKAGKGGGGNGGNGGSGAAAGACGSSQEQALECLGVQLTKDPRVDLKGSPLPTTYAPLGATRSVGVSQEVFMAGMQLAPKNPVGTAEVMDNRAALLELSNDDTGAVGPGVLSTTAPGAIWEGDTYTTPSSNGGTGAQSSRTAVALDADGDGKDEIVVLYLDHENPSNEGVIFATSPDGGAPKKVATAPGAEDIAAVRGDFDGDGKDEIALGISTADGASVVVLRPAQDGSFSAVDGSEKTFEKTLPTGTLSLELAAGNIDRDLGDELVVVFNQMDLPARSGISSYWVIDDGKAGFTELKKNASINVVDGGSYQAEVADVAIGDIDADGKGEIVFGGVEKLLEQSCVPTRQLYLALDDAGDAPEPLAVIGQSAAEIQYVDKSGCSEVTSKLLTRHVFVNTLDVDGDGVAEIQANLRVFDDFRAGAFKELYALDPEVLAGPDGLGGGILAPDSTAMETADINGDGRDEIIVFAQHRSEVVVWGLSGPTAESATFQEMTRIDTKKYNFQSRVFPLIVPANVDTDGVVLKYSAPEYKFVFTEPVVIAALAAAPCMDGIGQNTAACTTAYGQTQGTTGGGEASVTVTASTFVSFETKIPLTEIGVEGKETLTTSASLSAGKSYALDETVEYTTGPLEDTVIFTTLPVDQYEYTVVSHPDPSKVGQHVVVNLPRTPITLQVERGFYNRSVVPGSPLIDDSVFLHTVGNIDSYPNEASADALINTGGFAHLGPAGELVDAAGHALGPLADKLLGRGLKTSKAITVGQGSGQTSTEIRFTDATDYQAGLEIGYEAELAVTGGGAGVKGAVGGSLGGSLGAMLSWGSSTSTVYRGTIGSIGESTFPDHVYSAGLFTYVYNYGKKDQPQFEVVSYWVDK